MVKRRDKRNLSLTKITLSEDGEGLSLTRGEKVSDFAETLKQKLGKKNLADLTNEGDSALKEYLRSFSRKNRLMDAETQQKLAEVLNCFQDLETKASNRHKTESERENTSEETYRKHLENQILKELVEYINKVGIEVIIEKHPDLLSIVLSKK